MNINIIVAYCKNKGIGINNQLPWKIKEDLIKFRNLTIGKQNNAIVMGKNTWLSLNQEYLKKRDNLIMSNSLNLNEKIDNNLIKTFQDYTSLKEFLIEKKYDEIWIIGGETIYDYFLNKDTELNVSKIYITYIDQSFDCDVFFPEINTNKFQFVSKEIFKNQEFNVFNIIYERKSNYLTS